MVVDHSPSIFRPRDVPVPNDKKNFVLCVGVDVLNQPLCDAKKGIAQFEHRSWKFTQEVIANLREMATLDCHNLGTHENIIEEKLIEMAEFVNDNGGWTVMGWHRRGTTNMGPNNEPVVTLQTLGHLMRIFPTSLADEKKDDYLATRFTHSPTAD